MEKLSHTLDLTKRVRADVKDAEEEEENYINIVIKERQQQQRAQITNVKILY